VSIASSLSPFPTREGILYSVGRAAKGKLTTVNTSLDRPTEALVSELVRTEFKEWTVMTVAHRLETIVDFDKVLVLQEGRIVEFDSPRTLLGKEKGQGGRGVFRGLWDLQH